MGGRVVGGALHAAALGPAVDLNAVDPHRRLSTQGGQVRGVGRHPAAGDLNGLLAGNIIEKRFAEKLVASRDRLGATLGRQEGLVALHDQVIGAADPPAVPAAGGGCGAQAAAGEI